MTSVARHTSFADRPHEREVIIKFEASGCVARYRHERGADVHVLRIWHGREDRQ